VASLFVVFGAGCGMLIAGLNNWDLGDGTVSPRAHLAAIPVSPKVCPYVRVMHKAANDFQRVNPIAGISTLESPAKTPWGPQRARIARRLRVFEFTVAASRAQFPAPIQRRFEVVLANIHKGRPLLAHSTDSFDLWMRASSTFSTGQTAYGEASDLVGNACGVHLAANRPWVLAVHKPR
jgi:hypothetical protein